MNIATWANITPYMVINLRAFNGRKSLAYSSFESPINRYQFLTNENVTKNFVPVQKKTVTIMKYKRTNLCTIHDANKISIICLP